ncbi:MAG: nitroreductase [Pseudomonadota bacterium]
MDVLDAIKNRRSIRAFKTDPVPRETLEAILDDSQRAPSGTNTQPWHTWICTGDVKDAISQDVLEMAGSGGGKSYDHYNYYPAKWNDAHNARRRGVGWSLYGLLGITREDKEGRARQGARNFTFFDAPVGLFVTIDSYLANGNWADTGMYIQTVMLAARGHGLETCPQAAWIPFQEPIFEHLGIPDDQVLVSGMSIGYPDPDAIENTLISDREDVADVVTWRGFD